MEEWKELLMLYQDKLGHFDDGHDDDNDHNKQMV
jgi:hypothetical protein